MTYDQLTLKQPEQCADYDGCSVFVITAIEAIVDAAIKTGQNKIIINTNLKLGLPMENINKIAGPLWRLGPSKSFRMWLRTRTTSTRS